MIGRTLGPYEIVAKLGEGGMGDVYKARDTRLDRLVALKVLPRDVRNDPERRERFEREAKAVAALNHPNIVTIHSVETVDDLSFMTMELVDGEPLTNVITSSGLPLTRLLAVAIPLVDAIAAAHEKGITHRDLKPANVMVSANGRVKVLDFGLAKVSGGALAGDGVTALPTALATGEGRILGTVAYMSPEQAEGKAIDARSDLFSLGVLLYEMATGRRPFTGDTTISIISSIVKDTPPSVTEINPALPRDLGRIVKRALAKDPERRYQTAKDLRNDLDELKASLDSGELVSDAARVTPTLRDRRPPATSWIALGLGAIAVAVIAIAVSLWQRTPSAPPSARDVQLTALTSSGNVSAAAISPDGRYVAYVQNDGSGPSVWMHQIASRSTVQIVPVIPGGSIPALTVNPDGSFVDYVKRDGTQWEIWRVPFLGGPARRIVDRAMSAPGWSPDGKRMAYLVNVPPNGVERQLVVAGADGSNPRVVASRRLPQRFQTLTLISRPDTRPAWLSDGRSIVVIANDEADQRGGVRIVAVDAETGAEKQLQEMHGLPLTRLGLVPAPNGRTIFATLPEQDGAPPQVVSVAVGSGSRTKLTNDLAQYGGLSIAGDSLITTRSETRSSVWIADAAGRGERRVGGDLPSRISGIAWTGASRLILGAALPDGFGIWAMDVASGASQLIVPDGLYPTAGLDGRTIAFQRRGGEIWRAAADGSKATRVVERGASSPQLTADASRLFYRSSQSGLQAPWVLDLASGTARVFASVQDNNTAISRDGRQVAVRSNLPDNPGLFLYTAEGGNPVRRLPLVNNRGELAWMPDGKGIAYIDESGTNIWVLPIAGGPARQLTSFTDGNLAAFDWSPDGKQLVVVREVITSNLVLLKGIQ